ncbi:hypothetical protein EVA_18797 [gut metagenome]|uniref:Uncharacterized protein n=1 Tax=gut metagenome TaxID=749906 RepID=J9G0L9_9ZZZZ
MLNKIDYFKGFGDYQEGVSRWSAETESYLFGIKETGAQNEEGQKEKEYYRYEYSRLLSPAEVEKAFIDTYMEYKGYDLATQLRINVSGNDAQLAEMREAMKEAQTYMMGIYRPGEQPEQEQEAYAEQVRKKVQNLLYAASVSEKINTFDLSNKEALAVKDLYPEWAVGLDVKVGEKYRVDKDLWQVVQAHKTQENWKHSLATASLWKRVDEEHEGTENDPIPYAPPMQIYQGKYYTQGGVKYKCTRDSGIPLSHNLAELVGLYVAKV